MIISKSFLTIKHRIILKILGIIMVHFLGNGTWGMTSNFSCNFYQCRGVPHCLGRGYQKLGAVDTHKRQHEYAQSGDRDCYKPF